MNNSSGQLRFGICGLGFMGRMYFGLLRDHQRAQVVAVCDRDTELRAGNWLGQTGNINPQGGEHVDLSGIAVSATTEEIIHNPDVDVVVVALPTPFHADVTDQALSAGKHVLCEKPMAHNLADCDRMIQAAEWTQKTLMVAHCIRFWPQYETIQRLVAEGCIGQVRFTKLKRISSAPTYSHNNWMMDGLTSGGALLDLHLHDVDFVQSWLGTPATIYARGCRGPSGAIDHVIATYGYPNGSYTLLEGSWLHHSPWPFEMAITVCGESGTLTWSSLADNDVLLYAGRAEPERIACSTQTGWQRELDYFIECIALKRPITRCRPSSTRSSIALALLEQQLIVSDGVHSMSPAL